MGGLRNIQLSSTFPEASSMPTPGQRTDIPRETQAMIVRSVCSLGLEALFNP